MSGKDDAYIVVKCRSVSFVYSVIVSKILDLLSAKIS
jgi:hypothetical protein